MSEPENSQIPEGRAPEEQPEVLEDGAAGMIGFFVLLVGGGAVLVSGLSCINVLFDLNMSLGVAGAGSALPRHWEGALGLGAAGLILMALGWLIGISGPLWKALFANKIVGVIGVTAMLFAGYQGCLQFSYHDKGGKLQWAGSKGKLDVIEDLLARDAEQTDICDAVDNALIKRRHEAFALLLPALEDVNACDAEEHILHLALHFGGPDSVRLLLATGLKKAEQHDDDDLTDFIRGRHTALEESDLIETVQLMIAAGWDPMVESTANPGVTGLKVAQDYGLDELERFLLALTAPPATPPAAEPTEPAAP